jgi:signal transduction histidine kinase
MVDRDIQADLPPIEARGGELNQVWTNLIANAADAISQTGRADGEITIRAFEEGDRVVVEIADNGSGIPTTIHDRIFDSFFTTKPPGSGTGLGLALSYRTVVDDHGGSIGFQSVPGNTVFRVELKRTLTDRPA